MITSKPFNHLMTILSDNLSLFQSLDPQLYTKLADKLINVKFSGRQISFFDQVVVEDYLVEVKGEIKSQLKTPDQIAFPRVSAKSPKFTSINDTLASTVGSTDCELLQSLPNLCTPHQISDNTSPIYNYRNLILLGSLSLFAIDDLINQRSHSLTSIVLVEDSIEQFIATLSIVNFTELISVFKSRGIGFVLHIDPDLRTLQDRLIHHFNYINPLILHGAQIFRSVVPSPALQRISSWLHAPEGANQVVQGVLGFTTDEFNQTQQSIYNNLKFPQRRLLDTIIDFHDKPVVLVSSGPSLDDNLDWLYHNQSNIYIVVAAV